MLLQIIVQKKYIKTRKISVFCFLNTINYLFIALFISITLWQTISLKILAFLATYLRIAIPKINK